MSRRRAFSITRKARRPAPSLPAAWCSDEGRTSHAFARRTVLGSAVAAVLLRRGRAWRAPADDKFIIVQSTTSTQNSGLFEHILPMFTKKTGIEVRVVAVGTGQALKNAENGDGDVVLVHSKPDEEKFVADGWGVKRHDVMYNDFIIVGPAADPAKIAGLKDAPRASRRLPKSQAPFASRGDDFGHAQGRAQALAGCRHRSQDRRAANGISRRAPAWARRSTRRSAKRPTR